MFLIFGRVGIVKWKIQELPPQSSGEQRESEEIIGVLCEPKRGQSGETTRRFGKQRRDKEVSRFHMVRILGVHSKPLQN